MNKAYVPLIGVIAIIACTVAIFFFPIFRGSVPVPSDALIGLYHPWRDAFSSDYPRGYPFKNFLVTDPVRQQIPWKKLVVDSFKQGEMPGWNPYNGLGMPLLGNIQASAFYPSIFIFYFLGFIQAWTIQVISGVFLSFVFMYLFLREQSLKKISSYMGGIAYAFGGVSVVWMEWGTISHVIAWLPFSLFSIHRFVRSGLSYRWALSSVIGIVCMGLSGHMQFALYGWIVIAAYFFAIRQKNGGLTIQRNMTHTFFVFLLIIGVPSLILLIPQFYPFFRAVISSGRTIESSVLTDGWYIPWKHLVQFVIPDFFGNPATLNYWGTWNYAEFCGYIGMGMVLFALVGSLGWRRRAIKFWLWIFAISMACALPTPIAQIPYALHIPFLSSLQPTRLLFPATFSLVLLASYGIDRILREKNNHAYRLPFVISIVMLSLFAVVIAMAKSGAAESANLLIAARNMGIPLLLAFIHVFLIYIMAIISSERTKRLIGIIIVIILVVDLFRFFTKFTPFSPVFTFFPQTKTISYLASLPKPFRIAVLDREAFPPNTASYYGVESVGLYDPISNSRYEEYIAATERGKPDITRPFGFNRIVTPENIQSPLFSYLNADYVISIHELNFPYLTESFTEGITHVYKNSASLPRIYMAKRILSETDQKRILEILYATDPKDYIAVVETTEAGIFGAGQGTAKIQLYSPNNITIETLASEKSFLVILNAYDPGWTAEIDGRKTEIHRTNYMFSGISVPSGTHMLKLRYNPYTI